MFNKKIYHLSHIDLDGYGSQVITSCCFTNIEFFNSNYGDQIKNTLISIFEKISDGEGTILITDLNLTPEISEWLHNEIVSREGRVSLQLLDHHKSGISSAEKYSWYFLDESRCATKITYDFFKSQGFKMDTYLINESRFNSFLFSEIVQSYDLYLKDHELFNKGKILNLAVFNLCYPFPFELKEKRSLFIRDALVSLVDFIDQGLSIREIESSKLIAIKEGFIYKKIPDELFYDQSVISDDKYNFYSGKLIAEMDFPIFVFDGIRLSCYYSMDSGVFNNIANAIVQVSDRFDACINISKQGRISIRSKENIDIEPIAKKYFFGGGHANASGGFLTKEKKEFSKEEVYDFLRNLSEKKEG